MKSYFFLSIFFAPLISFACEGSLSDYDIQNNALPSIAIENLKKRHIDMTLIKDITENFGHNFENNKIRIAARCFHGIGRSVSVISKVAQFITVRTLKKNYELSAGPASQYSDIEAKAYGSYPKLKAYEFYTDENGEKIAWALIIDMANKHIFASGSYSQFEAAKKLEKILQNSSSRARLIYFLKAKAINKTPASQLFFKQSYTDFENSSSSIPIKKDHYIVTAKFLEDNPGHIPKAVNLQVLYDSTEKLIRGLDNLFQSSEDAIK